MVLKQILLVKEPLPTPEGEESSKTVTHRRAEDSEPVAFSKAMNALQDADKISPNEALPLPLLKAMRSVVISSSMTHEEKSTLLQDMEEAISQSSLVYSAPPAEDGKISSEEQKKFSKRLERLRLRAEEAKYKKLTQNLDQTVADDVTMKSMSYAASVGLNMIVAPISFGVFMYFFAGSLFGWMTEGDQAPGQTDIKSVITGVISGVLMLFIEMTLFVIRSHEMDASVRKKSKKSHVNPFGYNKQRAMKTFQG